MNLSNELFEADPFVQDFLNETFEINGSGPHVLNQSFTTDAPATYPAQPAVIITVAVLAIVGNLLVIAVTTRRQTFPSASRLFISSMAWSDLLAGLTFTFMAAPAGAGEWVYSVTAARVCAVIGESSLALSMFALAGLCLDRDYALMNDGVGTSSKKAWIFLISAWIGIYAFHTFSTVYGVPVYYDPAMANANPQQQSNNPKTTPSHNSKTTPSNNHKTTPSNNNYNSDRMYAKRKVSPGKTVHSKCSVSRLGLQQEEYELAHNPHLQRQADLPSYGCLLPPE
ncbi:OPRM1 [Branchiostoma lanceolatum]|uniref:OPRM1 protein n=1 Tax=Branchiostoma lanceolatum TaxID=7740 RepID=A0A8K0EP29_BRALA|nr:OPRM1 [Branchiostoma lanceolatum]